MESTQIASNGFISAAYVIAALLFIFSLAGLSKQESAQRGNAFGMVGMVIALPESQVEKALEIFTEHGENAWLIGEIADAAENEEQVEIK